MKEILELQKQLAEAVASLQGSKTVAVAKNKRPSARAKPSKPAAPVKSSLAKFLPVETADDECVGSYHEKNGDKISPQSIKLVGKDELLIVWCPEHECAHYFLAQPSSDKTFEVSEVWKGAVAPKKIKVTPSGDMDTEAAIDLVEAWIESDASEDDEEDDDEEE